MTVKRVLKWTAAAIPLALLAAFGVAYARSDNDCGETAAPRARMKAVVYCEYGSPEVVRLADVEKPVPGDDQVVVRVRAAAVNPLDWHYMRGTPYIARWRWACASRSSPASASTTRGPSNRSVEA